MRICLITTSFPPDTGWDEPTRAAFELAISMRDLNHQVEVVTFSRMGTLWTKQDGLTIHHIDPDPTSAPLRIINSTTPLSNFTARSNSLLWKKFIALHKEKPFDVLDTNAYLGESLLPGLACSIPTVARLDRQVPVHLQNSLGFLGASAFSLDNDVFNSLKRTALQVADSIITPADVHAPEIKGLEEKVTVIEPGLDMSLFNPDQRQPSADAPPTLMLRGYAQKDVNHAFLRTVVAAVREKIPNLRVHFMAQDELIALHEDEVKTELSENGLVVDAVFANRMSVAIAPLFIAQADVCLLPGPSEWGSYAWQEPLAVGVPVVSAKDAIANKSIKHDEHALLFDGEDAQAATQFILKLFNEKETAKRIADAGRKLVGGVCDRKENARLTESIYLQAMENFHSPERLRARLSAVEFIMEDLQTLAVSYDKMLYNLLFAHSWSFRMKHWMKRLSSKARK